MTTTQQPAGATGLQPGPADRAAPADAVAGSRNYGSVPPVLDVVVPVHDEERAVEASVRRLHQHLATQLPFSFRITVADNASTDATYDIACRVAADLDRVRVVRLPEKGRGRALRQVWSESDAAVLAYTDVDLSTDLRACCRWWPPWSPATPRSPSAPGWPAARGWSAARDAR